MAHRNFARAMRRKTEWAGFGDAGATGALPVLISLVAGTAQVISQGITVAGVGAAAPEDETTLTRTIGILTATMNVATAEAFATVAVGLGLVTVEALAGGVGSMPSPEDRPEFEWIYYSVFQLSNAANVLLDGPITGVHFPFDVRGQRIIRPGHTLVWLAESQTSDVQVGVGGRYLLKLT